MADFKEKKILDRRFLPEPVFDAEPGLIDFYWEAWEQAWDHVIEFPGAPQSPYMAEGLTESVWTERIWIWDTCFMSLFCRYAPDIFPGVASLQNFYGPMYDGAESPLLIHHPDNPPLFAWVEYEHARFTGDIDRLHYVFSEKRYLQQHYEFFESAEKGRVFKWSSVPLRLRRLPAGYLWEGNSSGMDNTPRGRGDYDGILWFDALAQQALSALYISRIADVLGESGESTVYKDFYYSKLELLNSLYWNSDDGIYYDIRADDTAQHVRVKTPAAYWPMVAEGCDSSRAKMLCSSALDGRVFGGEKPWPSVPRDDPDFEPSGMYWRGGIWLPVAYAAIKGLEKYGFYAEAEESARALIKHMYNTYKDYSPHTIWECYSPEASEPATGKDNHSIVRGDFCGWSALGPISLFIENVLGFHTVDGFKKSVEWRKPAAGQAGIRNLRFGDVVTDIVSDGNNMVEINSNASYKLIINKKAFDIRPGKQSVKV